MRQLFCNDALYLFVRIKELLVLVKRIAVGHPRNIVAYDPLLIFLGKPQFRIGRQLIRIF